MILSFNIVLNLSPLSSVMIVGIFFRWYDSFDNMEPSFFPYAIYLLQVTLPLLISQ